MKMVQANALEKEWNSFVGFWIYVFIYSRIPWRVTEISLPGGSTSKAFLPYGNTWFARGISNKWIRPIGCEIISRMRRTLNLNCHSDEFTENIHQIRNAYSSRNEIHCGRKIRSILQGKIDEVSLQAYQLAHARTSYDFARLKVAFVQEILCVECAW